MSFASKIIIAATIVSACNYDTTHVTKVIRTTCTSHHTYHQSCQQSMTYYIGPGFDDVERLYIERAAVAWGDASYGNIIFSEVNGDADIIFIKENDLKSQGMLGGCGFSYLNDRIEIRLATDLGDHCGFITAAHELGHSIGLDHRSGTDTVMLASACDNTQSIEVGHIPISDVFESYGLNCPD